MKVIIRIMEEDNGIYNASHDIAEDIFSGGDDEFCDVAEAVQVLLDCGYHRPPGEFMGWGIVLAEDDTDKLISVTEDPD